MTNILRQHHWLRCRGLAWAAAMAFLLCHGKTIAQTRHLPAPPPSGPRVNASASWQNPTHHHSHPARGPETPPACAPSKHSPTVPQSVIPLPEEPGKEPVWPPNPTGRHKPKTPWKKLRELSPSLCHGETEATWKTEENQQVTLADWEAWDWECSVWSGFEESQNRLILTGHMNATGEHHVR